MDTIWKLRWLIYCCVSVALHKATALTFIDEQTSFLQLKKWNVSETRGLGFRFKTFLSDAFLLYMDDEGKTNFLRVELFQGKLRLTCSHGSRFGAMTVEIGERLNDLAWHQVLLERNKDKTTISLDSRSRSTVNSREKTSLNIQSSMYFGGLSPKFGANSVTQPSVILLNRFVGCITDIELFEYSAGQGKTRKAIVEDSNKILPGCTDMCDNDNTCQNNGTCLNKFTTTACDCMATGFRGKTCIEALPVLGLGQSDYVIFNRSNKAVSTQQDRIIFRFKTANQNGSLLESGRGRDYLVIELQRGSILLRWNLGSGEIYVHVREKVCSDNKWHSVYITRNQQQLHLTLDGDLYVSRTFPGRFISFDLKQGEGNVFIGGMPTNGLYLTSRSSGISFDGCLQEISFNGVDIVQGVVNGEKVFTTRGRPRSTCERPKDLDPTTASIASSTPRIVTDQATIEESATNYIQTPTSYTTTPMTTTNDYTNGGQRVPASSQTQISAGNSMIPCSDDEDGCDCMEYGSVICDTSGANSQSSGDMGSYPSSGDTVPNIMNKSSRKNEKEFATKGTSLESKDEFDGEPDITRKNCIEDDEDGCDKDDESGQGSAEPGSAGSASPTTTPPLVDKGGNHTKKDARAHVKKDSSKKWALIAGIIVVGALLVAFCIFAIWWLCKHKNDPHFNGMYNGSTEKCLQAEITDV